MARAMMTSMNHPITHPDWCSPAHCTAHDAGGLLGPAGMHESERVQTGIEWAVIRAEQGPVVGFLRQAARRRDAEVFLVWEIGREQVGHIRLPEAGPLALLIATGMDLLDARRDSGQNSQN